MQKALNYNTINLLAAVRDLIAIGRTKKERLGLAL